MRAEFDETLVTGNDMIDSQHKELIDRINQLLESCEEGQGKNQGCKDAGLPAGLYGFPF